MSVLFCEGTRGGLDAEVLSAIAPAGLRVRPVGSKTAIGPCVAGEIDNRVQAKCIRDRDFDSDPPAVEALQPFLWNRSEVGWTWSRHEIENYLIDPRLVRGALATVAGFTDAAYLSHLESAARSVVCLQAARWTIGAVRRSLPRRLEPDDEPRGFERDACLAWVRAWIEAHGEAFRRAIDPTAVETTFEGYRARFSNPGFGASLALTWFSGKDLLRAMNRSAESPGWWPRTKGVRDVTLDWVRANPAAAVALVPEWAALRGLLDA